MKNKENTQNQFCIDLNKPVSFCLHAVTENYFVENILEKRTDKKSIQLHSRLLRVGMIGHILYIKGNKQSGL